MPEGIKGKALTMLASQTPRVLIAIITIGSLVGLQWFGKFDPWIGGYITATGIIASIMNWLIVKKTGKEIEK